MVARSSLNLRHRSEPLARAVALLAAVAVVASVLVAGDASALSPAIGEAPAPFSPAVLGSAAVLNATAEALVQAQPRQLASTAVTAGWGHAGGGHSCGLRTDATIACWGGGGLGEADPPGGTFSAVSAGYSHSCGLRTDATIACWGNNSSGQADPPNGTFSAVSAGVGYACGLRSDAAIACWGANDSGRADPPSGTFGAVVAGVHQSCGLRTNGTVACWGADGSGVADAPSGTFSAVAVSGGQSCGLRTDATIICWGYTDWPGQADALDGTFSAVSAGWGHLCGLRTDATVICWGENDFGQTDAPGGSFSAVAAGGKHSCGLTTSSTIICWGDNSAGQADPPDGQFGPLPQDTSTSPETEDTATEDTATEDSATEDTRPANEGVPGVVRGLTATPVHGEGVEVRWSAPLDDGGSSIVGYEVEYSRGALTGHPVAGTTGARTIRRSVGGTSHFYEHLYSGVAYTVSVRAVNDAGSGSSATVTFAVFDTPGVVRGLTATPVHGEGVEVRWSAPLDDGGSSIVGYEVEYSRGALTGHPVAGTTGARTIRRSVGGTSHFYEHLYSGVAYTVSVRAVNDAGSGSSATVTFAVFDTPGVVRGLTATPVHGEGVEVRWSAPLDDGGSSIVGYEVEYSRGALTGHPVAGTTGARTIRRSVGGTSHFYEHLYSGVAYTVSVRAVNDAGSGSSATATFTIMRPCPAGDKFETKTESAWKLWKLGRRSTWIVALQDFVTIEGHAIEAGERGGKVSDESNLSQSGCSWIFEDAEVTGDARVSENAVVHGDARVYDNAQVYGSAEVFDNAKVYDNAQVYDNANVFGRAQVYGHARVYDHAIVHGRAKVYDTALVYERAQVFGEASVFLGSATPYDVNRFEHLGGQVYGEAKVYGQAKVHGYAELFGKAEFSGALEANDGEFDGEQEHVRAGQELYAEIFAHFARELTACDEDVGSYSSSDIPRIVRNLLNEDPLIRAISEIHVRNCQRLKTTREVLNFFIPKLTWWDVAFAVALTVTGLRGSFYLKSLVELAQGTKPLLDLSKISDDIEQWEVDATRMFEEFKKCKDSWNSAESCEP